MRFNSSEYGCSVISYEVSTIYDNRIRKGLIHESINQDTWKTGVKIESKLDSPTRIEVVNGYSSCRTRDVLPHRKVAGYSIKSPEIFIGLFDDWRIGMESYAVIS